MQATPLDSAPQVARHELYVHSYETIIALVVAFVVWRLTYAAIDRFFARRLLLRHPRASTYISPIKSITGFVVFIALGLTLLNIWTVNIGPAVWSAGVITAALAFGAQWVVRDLLAGYSIFAENQFEVGDTVEIVTGVNRDVAGVVEAIGLRTTRLIDKGGRTVFIPNGNIYIATNLSKGYKRLEIPVTVPWRADVEEMRKILAAVAEEAAKAAKLAPQDVSVTLEDFNVDKATFDVAIRAPQSAEGISESALRERIAAALQAKGWLGNTGNPGEAHTD